MSAGLALAVVGIFVLAVLYRRDRIKKGRERGQFYDRCLGLFDSYRVVQDDVDFPVLRGKYRNYDVKLEAIIDNMGWRKLPILHLSTSVIAPTGRRCVIDFLARPSGVDVFSQISHLEYRLTVPPDWPQDSLLFSDDPSNLPPLDLISPHVTRFPNLVLKELVVTPHGVRLISKISECSRAHYAAFREISFNDVALDANVVRSALDATIALFASVSMIEHQSKVA